MEFATMMGRNDDDDWGSGPGVRDYLDGLQEDDAAPVTPAKRVSPTDPQARWTAAPGGPAFYATAAIETGRALWNGELEGVETTPDLSAGNALRAELGHYAGAMFWFDGEWYWGLDRLELLELRLIEEGFSEGEPSVRREGVPFGKANDSFGEPVKLAFSLYPYVDQQGKGREYISRYLRAAWAEGVDITRPRALRRIIEDIGLSWQDAEPHLGSNEAEALLEDNVQDMLVAGLWGVSSFRLSGGDAPPVSCWGQDRLWRVEQEIIQRSGGTSS